MSLMGRYIDVTFLAGVQAGKEIYFSAWNINGLFKMNPETGKCTFLKKFLEEKAEYLHTDAVFYKDSVWFIPGQADRLAKVNIHTLEIVYISLPDGGRAIDRIPQVKFSALHNEREPYLWLTPQGYDQLLRVNMDTNEIQVCWEREDSNIQFSRSLMRDGILWLCPYDDPEGVCYDTRSGEISRYLLEEKEREYLNIESYKEWLLFFPRNLSEPIIKMNCRTYEKEYIHTHLNDQTCYAVSMKGSRACLVPYTGETYCIIDLDTNDICVMEDPWKKKFGYSGVWLSYYQVVEYDDKVVYLPLMGEIPSLVYDWKTETFCFWRFCIDLNDCKSEDTDTLREMCYRSWIANSHHKIVTDQTFGIGKLIEILDHIQSKEGENQVDQSIGEQIWKSISSGGNVCTGR